MIYFDNASTTRIKPEVVSVMHDSMLELYGNPSSTHSLGRKSKVALENARISISKILNCKPKEIIFTSGGTEADNAILKNAVYKLGVKRIISSAIEHHAVLDTLDLLRDEKDVEIIFIDLNDKGEVNLESLREHLKENTPTLVSLMHVNNEIGNTLDINSVAEICKEHGAYFHSDTVQAISHYKYDLQKLNIDFLCASAHKFGGPKGVGFMFKREGIAFEKMIHGGEQERNSRAGTENLHSIIGMQKAIEMSYANFDEYEKHILSLKNHLISEVKKNYPEIKFNGYSDNPEKSVSTIVSLSLPKSSKSKMLVFNFDLKGIAISEGSACASGRNLESHVIKNISGESADRSNIRVSFGPQNTKEEVDIFINALKDFI